MRINNTVLVEKYMVFVQFSEKVMGEATKLKIARRLRKSQTWAERLLWSWLRGRRFWDYKFRRQHPFGPYILDFFCKEAMVAVELDGWGHGHAAKRRRDTERDKWLEAQGVKVLRFWNWQLRRERRAVREKILRTLWERSPRTAPHYWQKVVLDGRDSPSP